MKLLGLENPFEHNNLIALYSRVYNWAGSRMQVLQVSPMKEWGNPKHKYFYVSNEDATMLMLQFPELVVCKWTERIAPDNNQEVKVMCRRCNGYVFSVSGHEWKNEPAYQVYACTPQSDGTCQYE